MSYNQLMERIRAPPDQRTNVLYAKADLIGRATGPLSTSWVYH